MDPMVATRKTGSSFRGVSSQVIPHVSMRFVFIELLLELVLLLHVVRGMVFSACAMYDM